MNNKDIEYLVDLVSEEIKASMAVLEEDPGNEEEQENLVKARAVLNKLIMMVDPNA